MPLINGQKMACEPCIRGHRSTKCTHANERLMVPVRKPGRPLSSCPHPPSKPCSCGQVTAAIPRKQKCNCGPSTPATQIAGATNGDSTTEDSDTKSPSPTGSKAPSTSFRVQKTRRGSTRKQSIDPTSVERTDQSQLNIIPAPNGLNGAGAGAISPTETASPMSAPSQYGPAGMPSIDHQINPQQYMIPMFQQPIPNQMFFPPAPNGGIPQATTNGAAASGGCCGGGVDAKREESDADLLDSQHISRHNSVSNVSDGQSNSGVKTKSCCSSKAENFEPEAPTATTSNMQAHAGPMMMPQFPTPMATPPNMYPYFAHPGIFTYPPQYGTFMQPLQPDQWKQMMAAFNYGQIAAQQHAFELMNAGMGNGPVVTPTAPPTHGQVFEAKAGGTSHHCSCGQECQCVGCATHPYNEATKDYVRSAMLDQQDAPVENGDLTNGHTSEQGASATHTPPGGSAISMAQLPPDGNITAPQTPSDAPSGLSEEQTLSASDFFFVTYPFGEPCDGESASCPCGDDCQCIGCVIHNIPDPSQSIDQEA
ncbi:unnamed protein product [Clonostachys rosea f. rosea IK726]|uniref:Copper-fist domain-containing protein n=3 Tax=Bionectria ochroleuca TaxID=29856 RepID=A0A0B7KPE7_BIOOC|nr:unnamed protein product [Clonostachys rosea f. rosea IK726]